VIASTPCRDPRKTCVKPAQLIQAVQKASKNVAPLSSSRVGHLLELLATKNASKRFGVSTSEGMTILNTADIVYCESEGPYCKFYFAGNKTLVASRTLKETEEALHDADFCRIHNSYLVNMKFVERYIRAGYGKSDISTLVRHMDGKSARETKLQYLDKFRISGDSCFKVQFSNKYFLYIIPSGLSLKVVDSSGKYYKAFSWQYEGPIDGRGTHCDVCADDDIDAMGILRSVHFETPGKGERIMLANTVLLKDELSSVYFSFGHPVSQLGLLHGLKRNKLGPPTPARYRMRKHKIKGIL